MISVETKEMEYHTMQIEFKKRISPTKNRMVRDGTNTSPKSEAVDIFSKLWILIFTLIFD